MRVSTGPRGQLALLQACPMTQDVQNNIVLWLLSRFCAADKRVGGPNVVKEMIIALIKSVNMAGLTDQIDLLKDTMKAWITSMKGINHHWAKISTAVMEVLADAREDTHVVANIVAEKVLCTKSMASFLNIKLDCLKQLALSAPNPKLACICETQESYMHGFRSVLQNGKTAIGSSQIMFGETTVLSRHPRTPGNTRCNVAKHGAINRNAARKTPFIQLDHQLVTRIHI